ncbi:hypothetical protein B0I37DRAFT_413438 [Chaetomium sp. MPI-CAGE-AT-0009]|nr:hypothetical protein B0I37DRAFT_413438 [Chaetomium sp. MPI-CAGE-AT-0009]
MLSSNPALSSPPPLELRTATHSTPARALQSIAATPDNGYVSPRQQLERHTPTSGSPLQPSQPQPQPQHGLNPPRASLSPLSEYHSGFADEDLGSPFNPSNHRRQQSFPNLLPLAFKSRTPSPTRKTHSRSPSEQMPYTGDGRSKGGGLVSWLSGSAGAADTLGLSHNPETRNTPEPGSSTDVTAPNITPTRPQQTRAGQSTTTSNLTTPKSTTTTTAASRFMSALSSRFNPTTPTASPLPSAAADHPKDELCTLNIEAALFPSSPSSPSGAARDTFSPSAFKNLHINAVGLLNKMQTAYREQAAVLRNLQAERSAEKDELEEAVTRAEHLKIQLEGMARKAADHEKAALVGTARRAPSSVGEGASMVSEDLGAEEEDRRQRRGGRHRKSGGGSGEEEDTTTDDESAGSESVFSRCRSPTLPLHSPLQQAHTVTSMSDGASSVAGVPDAPGTPHATRTPGSGSVNATPRQRAGQQLSAFQKIFKGISREDAGCANCKGKDASVAWDTVSLLRDENRHLKTRVGELEVAVEGALDLVNGIGL